MGTMDHQVAILVSDALKLRLQAVTDDLSMKEVESWDSLTHMDLILSLEQSFGVQLTFDEIVVMQTVGDIKRILNQKKNQTNVTA